MKHSQMSKIMILIIIIAREIRKLWNIWVTVIPVIIGAPGMVPKGLVRALEELEIGGRAGTIQSIVLLRSARILRLEETCCHSDSSERPSANADMKNVQWGIRGLGVSERL